MSPVVVLVGMPGSGKSTVGPIVAERLGVAFRDTDDDIGRRTGVPVADAFLDLGEQAFRELERDVVLVSLAEHRGVLALGGGAVLDERVRAVLAPLPVVWLQVGTAAAVHRVGLSGPRPVFLGNVRGQFADLAESRRPLYEEVASASVATDDLLPNSAAAAVLEVLEDLR